MLLALDIGNTNLTLGLFDAQKLVETWRFATRRGATGDELAAQFYVALQSKGFAFSQITGFAFCGVVPSLLAPARFFGRDYLKIEPIIASHDLDFGLQNAYDDPKAVGADRLVNGLAAWKMANGRGVVVADFGTATTIDAVSANGTYQGGAIAPGIGISSDALFQSAAKLPRVELIAPPQCLAKNTVQSIQAGLVFGYAGLAKELLSRAIDEIEALDGQKPLVLATGGLAELIAPMVPQIERVENDLTLEGLRLIWEMQPRK